MSVEELQKRIEELEKENKQLEEKLKNINHCNGCNRDHDDFNYCECCDKKYCEKGLGSDFRICEWCSSNTCNDGICGKECVECDVFHCRGCEDGCVNFGEEEEKELCDLIVKELKEKCKEQDIKGYSKLKKDELIKLLTPLEKLSVKDLKERCKEQGIKGYSKLKKQQLLDLLKDCE